MYICCYMVLMVSATTAEEIKNFVELGYTNPAYWKVKPCKLDARSHELNQTCPLIAIPTPMALEKKDNPEQAFPITLKCANTENGTLEFMSKYKNGRVAFIQATYKNKKLVLVSDLDGLIVDFTKNLLKWSKDSPVKKMHPDELRSLFATNPELLRQKVCLILK